jgi:hypothetical protein
MSDNKMSGRNNPFNPHDPRLARFHDAIESFATTVAKMARESIAQQLEPNVGPLYAQDAVAGMLDLHAGATRAELVRYTGLDEETVTKACAHLKAVGRIYKLGGRRYARWFPMRPEYMKKVP